MPPEGPESELPPALTAWLRERKVKDQLFGAEKERDPLSEVWDAHLSEIYPVYL